MRTEIDFEMIPENLDWCDSHYVPPIQEHIHCPSFGRCDGTDGSCHWCMEMTPYQHMMCEDETWLQSLIRNGSYQNRESATEFIDKYKAAHPRRSIIEILYERYEFRKAMYDDSE